MCDFKNLFDKETVGNISNLVENKMYILNNIADFKEKDKNFAVSMEKFESSLTDDLRFQFNEIMRLNFQIESYYFTLAYFIGNQHGRQTENLT